MNLYCAMPKRTESQVIGKQMLRSGTSGGAHYREALPARSTAEYVSKLEGDMQELEETMYWAISFDFVCVHVSVLSIGHR